MENLPYSTWVCHALFAMRGDNRRQNKEHGRRCRPCCPCLSVRDSRLSAIGEMVRPLLPKLVGAHWDNGEEQWDQPPGVAAALLRQ
jgi:hypothetical protein